MNILIPDSWLRELVKNEAKPKEIARALSLCSLSVDKLETAADGDSIYHIEVSPNRYDCLSVIGVAREAVAVLPRFGHQATLKGLTGTPLPSPKKARLSLQIQVDKNLCPHFAAAVMDNVKIKPSPTIIRQRLEKAGIRALNNVIDVTNYLMLETGQPMHAFDFDKLSPRKNPAEEKPFGFTPSTRRVEEPASPAGRSAGFGSTKKMLLRASRVGEWLVTLDGVQRQLPPGSIVIEDGEKLIDLCGIMGGKNSAIDKQTQRVILFAQIYDPRRVRKTSMALPLRTEAAQRFEKGLDPEAVLPTLYQSIKMLEENAGAIIASQLYNLRQKPSTPHQVSLGTKKLHQYLGVALPPKEVISILSSLGFQSDIPLSSSVLRSPSSVLKLTTPSWRDQDITIEEDLIEEVARLYGYHNLPTTLPVGEPAAARSEPRFAYEHRLKFLLKDLGFTEVFTSSLVSQEMVSNYPAVKINNPLGPETEYLKADTFPSLVQIAQENLQRCEGLRIFEIGNTYQTQPSGELPKEKNFLTVALTTNDERHEENYLKVKGLIERIFDEFHLSAFAFKDFFTFPYDLEIAIEPRSSFVIWPTQETKSGKLLGVGGPSTRVPNLWLFKLHLEALWELAQPLKSFTPLPIHPPLIEEISFYLPQKITYAAAVETIKAAGGGVLKNIELADYYTEENLQKKGQKSLTLKLTFADPRKTLESKEVQPVREKIIKALQEKLGAVVRAKVL